MQDTDLFRAALGLSSPLTVTRSEFAVEDSRLDGLLNLAPAGLLSRQNSVAAALRGARSVGAHAVYVRLDRGLGAAPQHRPRTQGDRHSLDPRSKEIEDTK